MIFFVALISSGMWPKILTNLLYILKAKENNDSKTLRGMKLSNIMTQKQGEEEKKSNLMTWECADKRD